MNKETVKIITYLSKKENWTPMLTYVHRTRFLLGTVFGLIFGIYIGILYTLLIYVIYTGGL